MPKKKKIERDEVMERTRAAVAYCNTKPNDKRLKLVAFLVNVEGMPEDKARALAKEMTEGEESYEILQH